MFNFSFFGTMCHKCGCKITAIFRNIQTFRISFSYCPRSFFIMGSRLYVTLAVRHP